MREDFAWHWGNHRFFSICFLKVVVIVCRVPFNGSYIPFRLGFAASLPEGVGYLEEQRQSKKHSSNAISQNSYNWLTQQTKVGPKILKVLQRQTKTSKSHKNLQTDVSIAFSYIYSDWWVGRISHMFSSHQHIRDWSLAPHGDSFLA